LGFFPLDEQLKLWDKNWSEGVAKEAVWLSGVVGSFEKAEETMKRIGHLDISDSTIWRKVERWGTEFEKLEKQKQEEAVKLPNRGEVVATIPKQANERMGAAMDGGMVHIRAEGWKELKAGCIYNIKQKVVFDEKTQDFIEVGRAVNNSYVAHLGEWQPFGHLLWAEAKQRGWEKVYDTQVIGDGARWIWNLSDEHFYDSVQTVDWYHASEHLHIAAQLSHPNDLRARQRWLNSNETSLFQGHAEKIAENLQTTASNTPAFADDLLSQAGYFCNNKRRMQYLEFREEGYPIGSGMIESGIKQFKSRFNGSGMRWSRSGIQRLIPIRASILSHQFDSLWHQAYYSPQN